jgi:hypothetical protein
MRFLALVASFVAALTLAGCFEGPKGDPGAEGEEMSARHLSAGLWTLEEDDQLRALAASGESSSKVGRLLNRSPSAVRKRASLIRLAGWNGAGLKAKGK